MKLKPHMRIKFLFLGLFFLAVNSIANDAIEIPLDNDHQVSMEADQIYYGKSTDTAHAKGNVILQQEGRTILAQQLIYDRNSQEVYAYDDVVMLEPDGSVYFADQAKINLKSDHAIAINFKGKMGIAGKIAAKGAFMDDKRHMHLEDFVYSPCKICQDNLRSDFPLWEIRADSAELNKNDERIYYKNAYLEAFGLPFLYIPYFSTPAPGASRKTGFLPLKIKYANVDGASVQIPFYWNIALQMDMTYRPTIMQNEGVVRGVKSARAKGISKNILNEIEFRHKIMQGEYKLKTSFIVNDEVKKVGRLQPVKEMRGHYDLQGEFRTQDKGYFSVKSRFLYDQMQLDRSKSYLKKYTINNDDVLTTDLNYRYLNNNDFHSARTLFFQGLRPSDDHQTTLHGLPIFDGYYEKKMPMLRSSKFNIIYNVAHLFREEGSSFEKTTIKPGISTLVKMPYGQRLHVDASIRADAYRIKHKIIKAAQQDKAYSKSDSRIYPEIYSEWSWTFINFIQNRPIIIEPVVGFAIAPTIKKHSKLNSDSQYPEISANNLFTNNRFNGYDKIEDGNRASYGLRGNLKSIYFQNLSFLIGQALRQKQDNEFDYRSGLKGKSSNLVSRLSLQLNNSLSLSHRARYDQKTISPLRNEVNILWNAEKYNFSALYAGVNRNLINQHDQKFRQEMILNAGYNFYGQLWLKGYTHMSLKKKLKITKETKIDDGVSLEYKGECLLFEIGAKRNYQSVGDAKSSTSYTFSFIIPTF